MGHEIIASDHRKPDGLFVIAPGMGPAFVEMLAVGRFHGVGPATAARMEALGIRRGADLRDRLLGASLSGFEASSSGAAEQRPLARETGRPPWAIVLSAD